MRDHNEQERIDPLKRTATRHSLHYENKRPYVALGVIFGIVFTVFICIKEPGMMLFDKIALCITVTWICINGATYRGRYRPRIIYAFKICYPLFIFFLIMAAFGRL